VPLPSMPICGSGSHKIDERLQMPRYGINITEEEIEKMCYTYEEINEEVDKLEDDRERDLFIFQEFLTESDAVEHRFDERE
jgi:hypothetical protein